MSGYWTWRQRRTTAEMDVCGFGIHQCMAVRPQAMALCNHKLRNDTRCKCAACRPRGCLSGLHMTKRMFSMGYEKLDESARVLANFRERIEQSLKARSASEYRKSGRQTYHEAAVFHRPKHRASAQLCAGHTRTADTKCHASEEPRIVAIGNSLEHFEESLAIPWHLWWLFESRTKYNAHKLVCPPAARHQNVWPAKERNTAFQ